MMKYLNEKVCSRFLIVIIFICSGVMVVFPISNLDIFWHMANGRASLMQGRIVSDEIFSYTAYGEHFDNAKWLAQVVFYFVYDNLGANGLIAFKVLLTLLTIGIISRVAVKHGAHPLVAAMICFFAIFAGLHRFTVRPQIFSFLATALTLWFVYRDQHGRFSRKNFLALLLLFMTWNWFHGARYGLVVLAAYIAGQVADFLAREKFPGRLFSSTGIDARNLKILLFQFVGLLVFVNLDPLGPNPFSWVPRFAEMNFMLKYTGEFQPTSFHPLFVYYWIFLCALVLLAFHAIIKKNIPPFELFILVAFTVLSLRYARATGVFALVASPFISVQLTRFVKKILENHRVFGRALLFGSITVLILTATVFAKKPSGNGGPRDLYRLGGGINEYTYPVGSARFIKAVGLQGNMYNSQNFGGYFAYVLAPDRRIFHYNQPAIFGDIFQFLHDADEREKWNLNYAVVGEKMELDYVFKPDKWMPVYWEPNAIVMLKLAPENIKILERYGIQYFKPRMDESYFRQYFNRPKAGARLAREMSDYLSFRHDEKVARIFSDLIRQPVMQLSLQKRLRYLHACMQYNGENEALQVAMSELEKVNDLRKSFMN